jgi:hypothetical protein
MSNHTLLFSLTGKRWERNVWCHRVATYLREHEWDAEVIDYAAFWRLEELQELVKSRVSNKTVMFVFGTAFLNPWSPFFNEFIKWLKDTYSDIPTVLGGHNALVTAAENIDYWVDSYGENAVLALTRHLLGTLSEPLQIDRTYIGKRVIRGLHAYPSAPMASYYLDFEARDFMLPTDCPQIETARGCMFSCSYCNFPIIGQAQDVSVSKEEFKRQIQTGYDRWGIKNWRFVDETFNDRLEKIRKYAEVVDELDFDPWFCGFARGDLVVKHRKHWDDYIRLGFLGHSMGVETLNRDAGKVIRKGMDPAEFKEGILDFQAYTDTHAPRRYRANINLICGIPKETPATWYESLEWLNNNWTRQSASAWILEVSDYDQNLTNMSKFTKELKDGGLRKMSDNIDNPGYKVYKDDKGDVVFKTIQDGGVGTTRLNNIVVWEHDSMNWYQAKALVNEFYNTETGFKGRVGCNPFLSDRLFPMYDTNNYEDVYDINISEIDTADQKYKDQVQEYINKKLNWKSHV